jgi:hypothetical protein
MARFTFGPHVNGTPTLAKLENHMRALPIRLAVVISLLAICASAATTAEDPAIAPGGVLHAARRTPMGLSNSQIALGGIFVIGGKRLGPSIRIRGSAPYSTRLPDDPSGTSVRLTNVLNKTAVDAYVISASDEQVVAIASAATLAGEDGHRHLPRQDQRLGQVTVVSNFGIFTRNDLGHGPAVAMTIDSSGAATSRSALPHLHRQVRRWPFAALDWVGNHCGKWLSTAAFDITTSRS